MTQARSASWTFFAGSGKRTTRHRQVPFLYSLSILSLCPQVHIRSCAHGRGWGKATTGARSTAAAFTILTRSRRQALARALMCLPCLCGRRSHQQRPPDAEARSIANSEVTAPAHVPAPQELILKSKSAYEAGDGCLSRSESGEGRGVIPGAISIESAFPVQRRQSARRSPRR